MANDLFSMATTSLLVLTGIAQAVVLVGQRRQQRLDWAEEYRQQWMSLEDDWARIVYLGRRHGDYYQLADPDAVRKLAEDASKANNYEPTTWALYSARQVCGVLSDVCLRLLQGQMHIRDVYPIFGTGFLRHGAALRALLDSSFFLMPYGSLGPTDIELRHDRLRNEVQSWLVCHDGLRRRCLILMDLLWAEAARLEDLPPMDLQTAAEVKKKTGYKNRRRLFEEVRRVGGGVSIFRALRLSRFLKHAEYQRCFGIGLNPERLKALDKRWTERYLKT